MYLLIWVCFFLHSVSELQLVPSFVKGITWEFWKYLWGQIYMWKLDHCCFSKGGVCSCHLSIKEKQNNPLCSCKFFLFLCVSARWVLLLCSTIRKKKNKTLLSLFTSVRVRSMGKNTVISCTAELVCLPTSHELSAEGCFIKESSRTAIMVMLLL